MFWKKNNCEEILKNAPGPSPWYLREFPPEVKGLHWEDVPDDEHCSGIIILRNNLGEILGLFDFQNYVLPLDSGDLLIWHQPYQSKAPSKDISCVIVSPENLLSLGRETLSLCKQLRKSKSSSLLKCNNKEIFHIPTNVPAEHTITYEFSDQLMYLNEILFLCHSSGICDAYSYEEDNVGILKAIPKEKSYIVYPQEWFNKGGLDYGYQWITRVARGEDGKV